MHWSGKLILMAAGILCVNLAAQADSLTLTGANGPSDTGYVTGPYQIKDSTTYSTIQAICDDFDTDVSIGQTWTASAHTLGSLASLKFGVSDPAGLDPGDLLHEYQAAFYLATQLFALPNTPGNAGQIDDLSFAIWGIFSSSARNAGGYDAGAASLDATALAMSYGATQYFNDLIYTPNPLRASQEYLVLGPPTATPEPSSLLLLGTGLIGLLGFGLYQKRQMQMTTSRALSMQ